MAGRGMVLFTQEPRCDGKLCVNTVWAPNQLAFSIYINAVNTVTAMQIDDTLSHTILDHL